MERSFVAIQQLPQLPLKPTQKLQHSTNSLKPFVLDKVTPNTIRNVSATMTCLCMFPPVDLRHFDLGLFRSLNVDVFVARVTKTLDDLLAFFGFSVRSCFASEFGGRSEGETSESRDSVEVLQVIVVGWHANGDDE